MVILWPGEHLEVLDERNLDSVFGTLLDVDADVGGTACCCECKEPRGSECMYLVDVDGKIRMTFD